MIGLKKAVTPALRFSKLRKVATPESLYLTLN